MKLEKTMMHWQHNLPAVLRRALMMTCWSSCPWLQGWQRSSSSVGPLVLCQLLNIALSHLLWLCRLSLHLFQASGIVCPVTPKRQCLCTCHAAFLLSRTATRGD